MQLSHCLYRLPWHPNWLHIRCVAWRGVAWEVGPDGSERGWGWSIGRAVTCGLCDIIKVRAMCVSVGLINIANSPCLLGELDALTCLAIQCNLTTFESFCIYILVAQRTSAVCLFVCVGLSIHVCKCACWLSWAVVLWAAYSAA